MGAEVKATTREGRGLVSERLFEVLRERIASHDLAPGMKLREQALADEFKVSRARIRDALAGLAQRGLVLRIPGRGAVVQRLDVETALHILDMREVLEGLAVRLATRNAPAKTWNDLRALFKAPAKSARSREDLERYMRNYELFRRRVIIAAANEPLADTLNALHDKTKVLMRRVIIVSDRARHALDEHRAVLAAMRAGDADAAESLRRKSIAAAREYLAQYHAFLF